MIEKLVSLFGRGKAAILGLFAMAMVGMVSVASAQTTGDWDISGASAQVTTLLGAGAAVIILFVVFSLSKRGANKI